MDGLGFPVAALITGAITLATSIIGASSSKKQAKAQVQVAKKQNIAQYQAYLAQQQKQTNDLAMLQAMMEFQKAQQEQRAAELEAERQAERQAAKDKEKKIIKYGAIIATGFILYQTLKD